MIDVPTPRLEEAAVLRLLIELGAQVVGADEGSLLVLDAERRDLVFVMTVGASESKLIGQRVPLGQGLTGLAAATGEVQIGAPTYHGVEQPAGGEPPSPPQAVIAAPMLARGDLVGVITAVRFAPGKRFGPEDATLYGRIAAVAGVVVDQRRRLETVEGVEPAVAASVARIAAHGPEAAARMASILADVEALLAGGRTGAREG